jgi:hypothetical protein
LQPINKVEKNWSPLPLPDGTLHYLYDLEPLTLVQCKDLRNCEITWYDTVCRGKGAFPCPEALGQTVKRPDDVVSPSSLLSNIQWRRSCSAPGLP